MRHPESLKQALRRLRRDGWSYNQLSRISGLQPRTINTWCNPDLRTRDKVRKGAWYKRRHEHCRRVAKKSYWSNPEKQRKRMREWHESNKEHVLQYAKEYRKQNPSTCRLHESTRRARKRAVPGPHSEIEKLMIKYRYEDARRISKETGVKHEVDHTIPISKGGPHLPWNLQVITAKQNKEKYNKT